MQHRYNVNAMWPHLVYLTRTTNVIQSARTRPPSSHPSLRTRFLLTCSSNYLRLLRMMPAATATPTTAKARRFDFFVSIALMPEVLPGQPTQLQLGPQAQTSPQVQVPVALAGQGVSAVPHVPGQSAQRQVSPHWQLSPQVPLLRGWGRPNQVE